MPFDEVGYSDFFAALVGVPPYPYQIDMARLLIAGKNILLRAPTGAGKTLAVLAPFFYLYTQNGPARLIYALPLRSLANSIYQEATDLAGKLGLPTDAQLDQRGRERVSPFVTMQTGEQPDDKFFDRGRIIVTTYDQVLSGLLDGPYGLSDRLHNINAAAIAGALVVFDEFHLMEPARAFLTSVAFSNLFGDLCQSVWMTATATTALEAILVDALAVQMVPGGEMGREELLQSLPSVTQVTRTFQSHDYPLTADSVLQSHRNRSGVVVNTVGRAQRIFADLKEKLRTRPTPINLILLHSKFFSGDRRAKEQKLRTVFGKGSRHSAILVATQVVEAGLDISCDSLHTELCPMNALIQRAGRCARFPGEDGTVHVYPLPAEEKAWLPYGDTKGEDATMLRTRLVLERFPTGTMNYRDAVTWVEEVHAEDDAIAVREGWWDRQSKCIGLIEQNAIHRAPVRIAHLIRGDESDTLRLIVANHHDLPAAPGEREALSISRRALYRLFNSLPQPVGSVWDGSAEDPWKPIRSGEDIRKAYVICLPPQVAAYDSELGLMPGVPGSQVSPRRSEPPAPGYAPLRAESWVDHACRVSEESQRRLQRERFQTAPLGAAAWSRYGIPPEALSEAVRACALLHDLGKLQHEWQVWAETFQRSREPSYVHVVPLAHTDFDPANPNDRKREQGLKVRRPRHATASAYYGGALLARLLPSAPEDLRVPIASACAAAILAHHGGWFPAQDGQGGGIGHLCSEWASAVEQSLGITPDTVVISKLQYEADKRSRMQRLLGVCCNRDSLPRWWPLVAFLTRTVRLSDQRATAEVCYYE